MARVRMQWQGQLASEAVRLGARRAIADTTEDVKQDSLRVIPRETDTLARSAGTSLADYAPVGAVYYDDPRDVKTIKQHEDLSYRHPRGGTAKFLERPARAARGRFVAALAREIGRGLR